MSKYFANILSNVVGNKNRSIKNSAEFVEKLKSVKVPDGYTMMSLDVVSLFTNVPKELVTVAIQQRWNEIKSHTNIPLQRFIEGIELLMESCYFSFNGTHYRQINGSPMGAPSSPALVDLVMEYVEDLVFEKLNYSRIRILFYLRYVDDTFALVPTRHVQNVVDAFNSIHTRIQFTFEVESNRVLSFLDIRVVRLTNGTIIFDWYHKETWTGRYINFDSYLPMSYKMNTPKMFVQKILQLSHPSFHQKNFDLLVETMMKNGYSRKLLERTIADCKEKFGKPTDVKSTMDFNKTISLPYNHVAFNRLRITLAQHQIRVVAKALEPLGRQLFSKLKDPVPKEEKSGLVYKIVCSCGDVYVGQTEQYLKSRFDQHIKGEPSHSALSAHLHENGCSPPNFDDVRILCMEDRLDLRKVKEMIFIKTNLTMNLQTDSEELSECFYQLLPSN